MTRRISLIIGVAVAALTIGAPAASGDPWFADRQSQVDFWNYDPQTGKKIANTSPGIAPQDLAGQFSPQSGGVPQWQQALIARGEGLNKQQGLGVYSPAIQGPTFNISGQSQPEQALRIRSEALNRQYGLGEYSRTSEAPLLRRSAIDSPANKALRGDAPAQTSSGREIEWPQVGIGLGLGALLMIGVYLMLKATRQRPLAH